MTEEPGPLGFCRAFATADCVTQLESRMTGHPEDCRAVTEIFLELARKEPDQLRAVLALLDLPHYRRGMVSSLLSEVVQFLRLGYRQTLRSDMGDPLASDGQVLVWWLEQYSETEWAGIGLA